MKVRSVPDGASFMFHSKITNDGVVEFEDLLLIHNMKVLMLRFHCRIQHVISQGFPASCVPKRRVSLSQCVKSWNIHSVRHL